MILCGWCGRATECASHCGACGHVDPARPYEQRGLTAPVVAVAGGRPTLVPADVARRLADASAHLGPGATQARIAEYLDVSEKTVRRWQQVSGSRPVSAPLPARGSAA